MVEQTAIQLAKAYNTLMYGSVKGDTSDTKFNTPGTTFLKGAPISYFFNSQGRCWRSDPSTCFNSSSEFYEVRRVLLQQPEYPLGDHTAPATVRHHLLVSTFEQLTACYYSL